MASNNFGPSNAQLLQQSASHLLRITESTGIDFDTPLRPLFFGELREKINGLPMDLAPPFTILTTTFSSCASILCNEVGSYVLFNEGRRPADVSSEVAAIMAEIEALYKSGGKTDKDRIILLEGKLQKEGVPSLQRCDTTFNQLKGQTGLSTADFRSKLDAIRSDGEAKLDRFVQDDRDRFEAADRKTGHYQTGLADVNTAHQKLVGSFRILKDVPGVDVRLLGNLTKELGNLVPAIQTAVQKETDNLGQLVLGAKRRMEVANIIKDILARGVEVFVEGFRDKVRQKDMVRDAWRDEELRLAVQLRQYLGGAFRRYNDKRQEHHRRYAQLDNDYDINNPGAATEAKEEQSRLTRYVTVLDARLANIESSLACIRDIIENCGGEDQAQRVGSVVQNRLLCLEAPPTGFNREHTTFEAGTQPITGVPPVTFSPPSASLFANFPSSHSLADDIRNDLINDFRIQTVPSEVSELDVQDRRFAEDDEPESLVGDFNLINKDWATGFGNRF